MQEETPGKIETIRLFLSSFAVDITNPAAILTFLFAFTYFGISNLSSPVDGALLVTGVLVGTFLWWMSLSLVTWAVELKKNLLILFLTDYLRWKIPEIALCKEMVLA